MASRDRTALFDSLRRNNNNNTTKITRVNLEYARPPEVESTPVVQAPPEWIQIYETIKRDIVHIKEHSVCLHRLIEKRLQVSFDDDDAIAAQDKQIDVESDLITTVLARSTRNLAHICTVGITESGLELTSQERQSRENAMLALSVQVTSCAREFRAESKKHMNGIKKFADIPDSNSNDTYSSPSPYQDYQQQELERDDSELIERSQLRHAAIVKIAQRVNELASMFRELNSLVIDQGGILDRIDYNIEQTVVKVQAGTKDVTRAQESFKFGCTFKIIVFMAILIVIEVIIIVIKKSA